MASFADDAAWFPDRIDWKHGLIRLQRVDRAVLGNSAFLDGRTPLAGAGSLVEIVALDAFVSAMAGRPADIGWIFHESFCGSTLLARMLTIDGRVLCLREPQVLVDLANWKAAVGDRDTGRFDAVLGAVLAKLACRWPPDEAILIKPSNWANTIAADMVERSGGGGSAVMRIGLEPYLVAVLRGGRDRVAFVLALHAHIARARPDLAALAAAAMAEEEGAESDPLYTAVSHIVAVHWMQRRLSDEIAVPEIDYPEWMAAPQAAAERTAAALSLPLAADEIAASVSGELGRYSKAAAAPYDPDRQAARDRDVIATFGDQFEKARHLARRLGDRSGG